MKPNRLAWRCKPKGCEKSRYSVGIMSNASLEKPQQNQAIFHFMKYIVSTWKASSGKQVKFFPQTSTVFSRTLSHQMRHQRFYRLFLMNERSCGLAHTGVPHEWWYICGYEDFHAESSILITCCIYDHPREFCLCFLSEFRVGKSKGKFKYVTIPPMKVSKSKPGSHM